MKSFFAYFGFTRAERRGFSILMLLVFVISVITVTCRYFIDEQPLVHSVTYFSAADTKSDFRRNDTKPTIGHATDQGKKHRNISYFSFDPNGLAETDWQRLGFSSRQIAVIKNYEAKGGRFYKKEDVAKIYSISKEDYERIEPYIVIENKRNKETIANLPDWENKRYEKPKAITEPIDINEADSTAFKRLRGIGSVLSNRMVRYRDALGGFHTVSQIGEVYGVSPEVFEAIQPLLTVEDVTINRLNLNTSAMDELSRHPYISRKQARLIVNYRAQHGKFSSLDDLRKIPVLDDDFFRKIEPYIEF